MDAMCQAEVGGRGRLEGVSREIARQKKKKKKDAQLWDNLKYKNTFSLGNF